VFSEFINEKINQLYLTIIDYFIQLDQNPFKKKPLLQF